MAKKIIDDEFISKLEMISLDISKPMQGYFGGSHRVKSYGNTVEFADFREYVLGDDLRKIDWNLYSRFEKHYVKLFVDERQMHVQIFIDGSASMLGSNKQKAYCALKMAAGIAFLAVRSMDKVSFRLLQGDTCPDLCGTVNGTDAFNRAVLSLENIKFQGETDFNAAVMNCENVGYNDGLTIIISDFLTKSDWKAAVEYLLYRKRQVLLIQVLSPEELDPTYNGRIFLKDSEAEEITDLRNMKMRITPAAFKAYRQALDEYIDDMKDFCAKRAVDYVLADSSEPVEITLLNKLTEIGIIK